MSLRDEILALGMPLDDHGAIAAALPARTSIVPTEIGKGRIISTLGLEPANAFLDAVDSAPGFRHVKHLVANGWLDIGDAMTRATVQSLVPALLTEEQATALLALAVITAPVTSQEVTKALEGM